ncbi:hypothetical protein JMN32_22700 [Fulvivirga sp. 29W222]|uniref:UDP-N-acetylglucosamine kinase n=1 Tax=Fulvivirga marina TaxID=2494733 RepID=A0A937FZQ0_9BACT|nr:hypothetical protein [Fulvivirga marina]MBL6449139.1 hypothetical protein [Fulvivirga marina]
MSNKVYVFGGPNGVGKSTLGNQYSRNHNIRFVNPDQINSDQAILHGEPLSYIELNYAIDTYICSAIETEEQVLIENNLHNKESFKFLLSYINAYKAKSFCYFYYLDDVDELVRRVKVRAEHLGNIVSEDTVHERYAGSFNMILNEINSFDEIHFFDVSNLTPVKVFEVFNGELNYINEKEEFEWSNKLIDQILNN